MRVIRLIPFILIIIGTIGLLSLEFLVKERGDFSRTLVLTFAVFNLLGLVILALARKSRQGE